MKRVSTRRSGGFDLAQSCEGLISDLKIVIAILFLWVNGLIWGDVYGQTPSSKRFYVELEPLQFLSDGFSVVGHYAISQRVQLGVNIFNSTLSEGLQDLVWNRQESFQLEARQSLGINVSLRYFLNRQKNHEGWVVSLPLGYETWELRETDTSASQDYDFYYVGPRIGYLWTPGKSNFYILAEAVLVIPLVSDGKVALSDDRIAINSLIPFPGLGIGYRF